MKRQYVSILGSRQIGKTSLLFKIQAVLRHRRIPCAIIDISTLQVEQDTANWYNKLATQLSDQLEVDSPTRYRDKSVSDLPTFISFLDSLEVVSSPRKWAVIMFDEAAAVPQHLTDLFFTRLRALYNHRISPRASPATRLVFAFAGAFYPAALVTNILVSPFNASFEVKVPDFQRQEVEKLLEGFTHYGLHLEDDAVNEIWDAARGHPFLTQKICQNLVYASMQTIRLDEVKMVVQDIVSHDAHLQNLVRRLDENPSYVELIRKVVVEREKIRMNINVNAPAAQLEMIGALTIGPDGFARVRNGIYGRLLREYLNNRMKA